MRHPLKHYARAIYEATQEPEGNLATITKNFVQLLHRDGVLSKADAIMTLFKKHWNEQKKEIDLEVTTAHPISNVQKKHLGDTIAEMMNPVRGSPPPAGPSGRASVGEASNGVKVTTVELHATVDEQLLGGVAIRYDDTIIDGSVRRQLAMIRDRMLRI